MTTDQVIYGHAGADPSFLIDFAQLFPGAEEPHPYGWMLRGEDFQ